MTKYKVIIEEITEYDEVVSEYRLPEDEKTVYSSKYDVTEEFRRKLIRSTRITGEKRQQTKEIYDQTVDTLEIQAVIKAVNGMK